MPRPQSLAVAAVLGALVLIGCGDDDSEKKSQSSDCPPGGTELTYQNFGQPFFESYCTRCHSSALTGEARNGAPEDDNWDVLAKVRDEADDIDEMAGANGTRVHTEMPPNPPLPTDEERRKLSEWLACGAP